MFKLGPAVRIAALMILEKNQSNDDEIAGQCAFAGPRQFVRLQTLTAFGRFLASHRPDNARPLTIPGRLGHANAGHRAN